MPRGEDASDARRCFLRRSLIVVEHVDSHESFTIEHFQRPRGRYLRRIVEVKAEHRALRLHHADRPVRSPPMRTIAPGGLRAPDRSWGSLAAGTPGRAAHRGCRSAGSLPSATPKENIRGISGPASLMVTLRARPLASTGAVNHARFGSRMKGTGTMTALLRQRFERACREFGPNTTESPGLDTTAFRVPDGAQISLF
jgi:hypothetical protein